MIFVSMWRNFIQFSSIFFYHLYFKVFTRIRLNRRTENEDYEIAINKARNDARNFNTRMWRKLIGEQRMQMNWEIVDSALSDSESKQMDICEKCKIQIFMRLSWHVLTFISSNINELLLRYSNNVFLSLMFPFFNFFSQEDTLQEDVPMKKLNHCCYRNHKEESMNWK